MAMMARRLRMAKLKAMAVLKATVLSVAIRRESANTARCSAAAWVSPQARAVAKISRQWLSSQ